MPGITMVYESGGQNPIEGDMPWSVGDPFTWRKPPPADVLKILRTQVDPHGVFTSIPGM